MPIRRPGAYVGMPQYAGGLPGGGLAVAPNAASFIGLDSVNSAVFQSSVTIDPAIVPGTQSGDLLLVSINYSAVGGVPSTLTNTGGSMTRIKAVQGPTASRYQEVWHGVYAGAALEFTASVDILSGISVAVLRGFSFGSATPSSSSGTNTSQVICPTFTTVGNNRLAVYFVAAFNGDSTRNWNASQSTLTLWAQQNGGTGTRVQVWIGYKEIAVAGAVGSQTLTAAGLTDRFGHAFQLNKPV